ncbi:replication protein RepB, partial [Salmonella enterica subsp. enterica]|nr:replication protein RepB [Salmonella enterica subsp. enterica]
RVAESRADYEQRAAERRAFVAEQRAQGVPLADIAQRMGTTVDAVKSLHKQARKEAAG